MTTNAEIKLTYNWMQDRCTVGKIVMDAAGNKKDIAKKIINEHLKPNGIYEEALVLQLAQDIDNIPDIDRKPNVKVVKVDTSSDIGALFAALFGK